MSLIKVPFIILDSYVSDKSSTPPTPPPSRNEYVKEGEKFQATFWRYENRAERVIYNLLCLAECAVILAINYPAHTISHTILSFLNISDKGPSPPIGLEFPLLSFTGITLSILGGLLRMYCFRALGRLFTFDFCIRKDHKLITTGPYAIVRHPSYSGYLVAYVGMLINHLTRGSLLTEYLFMFPDRFHAKKVMAAWFILRAMRCAFVFARSKQEDEGLRKTFGKEWEMWAKRVNSKVLPGIF